MNGSMQAFVTSKPGDLYPASMGTLQLRYVLGGTTPQILWENATRPTSSASIILLEFSVDGVLVCIHNYYQFTTFLPPLPTLCRKVSAEKICLPWFWCSSSGGIS